MSFQFRFLDPGEIEGWHITVPVGEALEELHGYFKGNDAQLIECIDLAAAWVVERSGYTPGETGRLDAQYARAFINGITNSGISMLVGELDSYSVDNLLCALAYRQLDESAFAAAKGDAALAVWALWDVHLAINELRRRRKASSASERARRAALKSHQEHIDLKREAVELYLAKRSSFKTKNAAAAAIAGKILPVSYETVRKWLRGA